MSNPFYNLVQWYFSKKALPYWCIITLDSILLIFAGILSYYLFNGGDKLATNFWPLVGTLCFYLIFYFVGFRVMHTYSGVIRYSSFNDLWRVATANFIGIVLIFAARHILGFDQWFVPLMAKTLFVSFLFATLFMTLLRVIIKVSFDSAMVGSDSQRAFIYGTKKGGISIARSIIEDPNQHFRICGFASDSDYMPGRILLGYTVYPNDEKLISVLKAEKVRVFIVSPLKQDRLVTNRALVDKLAENHIQILMMNQPEAWDGKSPIKTSQLREIQIEDLLPRDEIQVDLDAVRNMITGTRVLITGSAGSIGSEMVRQVALFKPAAMMLIDQAETPQHDIRLMMARDFPDIPAETVVTTIASKTRMENIFAQYRPDYVFHAAAYKHVPMMENNPSAAVLNNILGTKILADLSVKYGVKKFVMVSTDKAVNPTNVMGCSKRICEIYCQALNKALMEKGAKDGAEGANSSPFTLHPSLNPSLFPLHPSRTQCQFVTTRFGNVLGSNGSVIPLFKEQIKNGGPVTVTHPNIIRFFMLIPEACKLVLEAGTMGHGGEIFVFDMGEPVKISDLAKRMIQLSGAQNVEIKYTGLRDGEKLYEEVLNEEEHTKPTFNKKIKIAEVREYEYEEVNRTIQELIDVSKKYDDMATVALMKRLVPEYKSQHSKYEVLDKK